MILSLSDATLLSGKLSYDTVIFETSSSGTARLNNLFVVLVIIMTIDDSDNDLPVQC